MKKGSVLYLFMYFVIFRMKVLRLEDFADILLSVDISDESVVVCVCIDYRSPERCSVCGTMIRMAM